jgi:hypothetical protein
MPKSTYLLVTDSVDVLQLSIVSMQELNEKEANRILAIRSNKLNIPQATKLDWSQYVAWLFTRQSGIGYGGG